MPHDVPLAVGADGMSSHCTWGGKVPWNAYVKIGIAMGASLSVGHAYVLNGYSSVPATTN